MNNHQEGKRMDRRKAIKWISSATASLSVPGGAAFGATSAGLSPAAAPGGTGYGPDPDTTRVYQPGDLWPLTLSKDQRALLTVLCDIIVPAGPDSPSASQVGVPDFVDEWISSPYPGQAGDRTIVLRGLDGLQNEARQRSRSGFADADPSVRIAICKDFAKAAKTDSKKDPGRSFKRLRDLIAGGYYTTPEGMKDIGYRGNISVASWDGPPKEVLDQLGLEPESQSD
jgi:hypothetical protein